MKNKTRKAGRPSSAPPVVALTVNGETWAFRFIRGSSCDNLALVADADREIVLADDCNDPALIGCVIREAIWKSLNPGRGRSAPRPFYDP